MEFVGGFVVGSSSPHVWGWTAYGFNKYGGCEAMTKSKKFKVSLEYRIRDTVEVNAKNESEAEKIAVDMIDLNPSLAELYDSTVKEIHD